MKNNSPQSSSRNPPPSNRQLLTLLGIFVVLIGSIIWGIWILLNQLVNFIPPEVEQQLGKVIVPVYEEQAEFSTTQTQLNQLLDQLETHLPSSEQSERDYQLFYIPNETVNAIAIPGDTVIVYQGLLEQMESENELMMVLGHELGHFAHRDHLRSLGRGILIQATLNYFLGDLAGLASLVSNISEAQFSQAQETKADEFGLTLLYQSYGQVAGATDFFARLSETRANNWSFLATHPNPDKRVKHLEKLIQEKNYPLGEKTPLFPPFGRPE